MLKKIRLQGLVFGLLLACGSLLFSASFAASLPDFTKLAAEAAPAVVNISTTQTLNRQSSRQQEIPEIFRHFFGELPENHPQPRSQQRQSLGSGFIISADGYILTNNHVVENADEILVRLNDRSEYLAEVIGTDPSSDLALLKVAAKNLPAVKIGDSDKLQVGEWVLAIGSPFGFDYSVTAGIVSAKGRALPRETYVPFIQTDVAINPGNSGGPLFNLKGEVVGINSQIYTRSGGFMGLSFAIPMQLALEVADQLKNQGKVSRGWLGVAIQDINRDLAESFGLEKPQGALIANVDPDGPGAQGGLKAGDIIVQVNSTQINSSSDLPLAIGQIRPGTSTKFVLLREGKRRTLTFKVGERQEEVQQASTAAGNSSNEPVEAARLGLSVEVLSANLKQRWSLEKGVQVTEVKRNSAAQAAGIRRGDVLVSLGGTDISNPAHFRQLVADLPKNQSVAVRLVRNGSPIFVAIKPE